MQPLELHQDHAGLGARFRAVNGFEAVEDYGDWRSEYAALRGAAAVVDLGFRGRFCLTGADRVRLLNGQVTNDIKALQPGRGCRAAFCGPKGRMIADAEIYCLADELLVDVEPGLSAPLIERLERHAVAEDVQMVDAAPYYGLLSLQGPRAATALASLGLGVRAPELDRELVTAPHPEGDVYLARTPRLGATGFDLYAPVARLGVLWSGAVAAVRREGGAPAGFAAWEAVRFEAGIPRFGVEMDETTLPPEAGLDQDAISYTKGCYAGQETIARLRTYGQVAKALRGLRLLEPSGILPSRGATVSAGGRGVGSVASAFFSPAWGTRLAMGYLRREHNTPGAKVTVSLPDGSEAAAVVTRLPFGEPTGPAA